MVKLIGPLQSCRASGSLANTLTFGKNRSTQTMRKKPTPKQPRSGLQVSVRAMLTFLSHQWKLLTAAHKTTWAYAYPNTHLNNYTSFIRYNAKRMRALNGPTKTYPATETGALPFAITFTAAGGVRHIELQYAIVITINDAWGQFIIHAFAADPPWLAQNVIAVVQNDSLPTKTYRHSPLRPGLHAYRYWNFTTDGRMAPTIGPVQGDTVT